MLAFDTETGRIVPGRQFPPLICVSVATLDRAEVLSADAGLDRVWHELRAGRYLVGANVAFDLGVLIEHAKRTRGQAAAFELLKDVFTQLAASNILDVQHSATLQDIARADPQASYSLAAIAKRHAGITLDGKDGDGWRLRYEELAAVPLEQWPEDAIEYARQDAVATYQTAVALQLPQRNRGFEGSTIRAAWALSLMSAWGVRIDPVAVAQLQERVTADVAKAQAVATQAGVMRKDGSRDMKAIRAIIEQAFTARNMAVPTTGKGGIATDRQTLLATEHPALVALAEAGESMTEQSQWLDVLTGAGAMPVHGRYRVTVESGRTSAFGPNWQNPPRRPGVRECVIARPGMVLCSVDWAAAELRTFAQELLDRFGKSALADAFKAGRDPHLVTAANILGIKYHEAAANRKREDVKQARQLAKAANFGFPGGLGADSFCDFAKAGYGVTLTTERARELKATWLDTYPEVKLYFDAIGKGGERQTLEHRRSGFVRGGVPFSAACNHFFQHPVAAAAKLALWWLAWECYVGTKHPLDGAPPADKSVLWGSRPVLFLHDEVIVEVPEDCAHFCAHRIADVMRLALHRYCPDVPVEAEPALMRRWYKGAERVEVDWVIVPWEPT